MTRKMKRRDIIQAATTGSLVSLAGCPDFAGEGVPATTTLSPDQESPYTIDLIPVVAGPRNAVFELHLSGNDVSGYSSIGGLEIATQSKIFIRRILPLPVPGSGWLQTGLTIIISASTSTAGEPLLVGDIIDILTTFEEAAASTDQANMNHATLFPSEDQNLSEELLSNTTRFLIHLQARDSDAEIEQWGTGRHLTMGYDYQMQGDPPSESVSFAGVLFNFPTKDYCLDDSPPSDNRTTEETPPAPSQDAIDGFEDGSYEGSPWEVINRSGTIEVVEDSYEGTYALKMTDTNNGTNQLRSRITEEIQPGTVFSTMVKTDRLGPGEHRIYQIGEGGALSGNFASIRFRGGRVDINGNSIFAEPLWTNPEEDTWYEFQMEVVRNGEVIFRVLNTSGETISERRKNASQNSEYNYVQLITRNPTEETVSVWFDNVRYDIEDSR